MILRCFVGRFDDVHVTWPPLPLKQLTIERHFAAASVRPDGSPAIDLRFDESRMNLGPPAVETTLFHLHTALSRLTLNSIAGGPVSKIGIVLARRFTPHPAAFGLMFDVGFGSGIGDASFNAVPREGCAVFVDAIRERRLSAAAFDTQLAFTTLHELGHVFNLWHLEAPLSFLATSPEDAPHMSEAHQFVPTHRAFLARNGASDFVSPGGRPFGERGAGVSADDNPLDEPARSAPLLLTIAMTDHEFWHFEPVELDITLSVRRGFRHVQIPDVIDPGYDAFAIWIVGPDGSCRRYRPVARFCENHARQTITSKAPFRRDISIFGQSGGYTFTAAGAHKVFCTFAVGRRVVRSNTLEIVVKPIPIRGEKYQRIARTLQQRKHARLLFYKTIWNPLQHIEPLTAVAADMRGKATAANIRYHLARALLRAAPRTRETRRKYQRLAADLLHTSLASGKLGKAREDKASNCLEAIEY